MIEKELQVEKLIKDLRDIKIIIKNHFHHEFKEDLLYHPRNCIDLDEICGQLEVHQKGKSEDVINGPIQETVSNDLQSNELSHNVTQLSTKNIMIPDDHLQIMRTSREKKKKLKRQN